MLKVLVTSYYHSANTYVKNIIDPLESFCEVVCDAKSFWISNTSFDIVHIQWPEELFRWQPLENSDITKLKNRLKYWKSKGAKIVVTRHNELPHRNHKLDKEFYDTIYHYSDAVIHLGVFSLNEFKSEKNKNVIIEHPNYIDLVEPLDKHSARTIINMPKKGNLFLCFGVIREEIEELQIIEGFKKVKQKGDYLYIVNSKIIKNKPSFRRKPISRLKYHIKNARLQQNGTFLMNRRLSNKEINVYFNAADIIVSPRVKSLNSGVVYMGFSFSKIVIGTNYGNIGALLKQTKNPVFEALNTDSIGTAIIQAKQKLETTLSIENYKFANTYCNPKVIAEEHYLLYSQLCEIK